MPRVIEAPSEEQIELDELVETLAAGHFDPDDEECFASFGPDLRRLGNNRTFLAAIVIEELKRRCEGQVRLNQYGAQVILLHARPSNFLIRANFWPATEDSVVRNSGTDPFFYGLAHDHNFSFLTVGYLGPGYWSDYYEYDPEKVVGVPGEKVDLRFVERSRLDQGKVMLYRAHRDVHLQLPPDAMSVSINILGVSHAQEFRDQYRFDVERSEIGSGLTQSTLEPLLALSACYGGGNGRDMLEYYTENHPSDRIRFAAVRALACGSGDFDERLAVYERAAGSANRFVSGMARHEADRLHASRRWIKGGGSPVQPERRGGFDDEPA
jgi:hypothetical protein